VTLPKFEKVFHQSKVEN